MACNPPPPSAHQELQQQLFSNRFSTILTRWLRYRSHSPSSLLWLSFPLHCSLPDSLISQPAGVALLVPILIGSLQLLGSSNDSAVLDTGLLCFLKVQGVPCGDCSVVEYDAWKTQRPSLTRLLGSNQPLSFQKSYRFKEQILHVN